MIIYAVLYNKFQDISLKLKEAEREIDETLRQKYDLMIGIVENIKSDEIHKIKDLKDSDLSSFDFMRSVTEYELKIINEISSNKKLQKNDDIKNKLEDIEEINIKLEAEKRYFNDNISIYNGLSNRFPSNVVAKILGIKEETYFDGKNMTDEKEKDFKL
jgi:hypothetical protein